MKAATLQELKKELQELSPKELIELCIKLAKYKKDNKEYLGFLMFESHDVPAFVKQIKSEIDDQFTEIETQTNLYFLKKSLRKILRIINKYCKYVNDKSVSAEIHIYFCLKIKEAGIPMDQSARLTNLYAGEIKKINSFINGLHEDLRHDYSSDLEKIAY